MTKFWYWFWFRWHVFWGYDRFKIEWNGGATSSVWWSYGGAKWFLRNHADDTHGIGYSGRILYFPNRTRVANITVNHPMEPHD